MPYRIPSPVTHQKIGRRGACLLIFGFVPFMIGLALTTNPVDRSGRPRMVPVLAFIAPGTFWSVLWMVLGFVVMLTAFAPERIRQYGYALGYGLPGFWAAAYVFSWCFGLLPTGWISAVVYLGYALLVTMIAGWPEEDLTPYPVAPWLRSVRESVDDDGSG